MPIYEYVCECGEMIEIPLRSNEIDDVSVGCKCGYIMKRIISRTGTPQVMDYYSENAGAHFTGPKQKARVLREKGLTEVGDIKMSDMNHHGKI